MYWKYPGSATVSLWLPLGSSLHTLGSDLHTENSRFMWDALPDKVSQALDSECHAI